MRDISRASWNRINMENWAPEIIFYLNVLPLCSRKCQKLREPCWWLPWMFEVIQMLIQLIFPNEIISFKHHTAAPLPSLETSESCFVGGWPSHSWHHRQSSRSNPQLAGNPCTPCCMTLKVFSLFLWRCLLHCGRCVRVTWKKELTIR